MNTQQAVANRIRELCKERGITLGQFFSTPEFDRLEQEIQ